MGMIFYHFLYDLAIFSVISWQQLFSPALNILERCICCSFILLAGISARFSRNNLRHGIIVLGAGVLVEWGAALGGQTIRFGILQLLGCSMLLWHFAGCYLQKLPGWCMVLASSILFFVAKGWTDTVQVSVSWLYPVGFPSSGFFSADYFPLLPWLFLFLAGTALGGWCLAHGNHPVLSLAMPKPFTFLGRHSLLIYLLHQPVLYGICCLLWG